MSTSRLVRDFGASSHDLSALLSLPTNQTKPNQTPKVEPSTFPAGSEIPDVPHEKDYSKRLADEPASGVKGGDGSASGPESQPGYGLVPTAGGGNGSNDEACSEAGSVSWGSVGPGGAGAGASGRDRSLFRDARGMLGNAPSAAS